MVDEEYPGRMLLAEANQLPAEVVDYFGTEDAPECQMCFHFPVMPRLYYSLREEKAAPIIDVLADTPPIPPGHPVGHVPAQPRRAHPRDGHPGGAAARCTAGTPPTRGCAPTSASAGGWRRCWTTRRAEIELIHALLLSLPGSPCLYYGDEIGMGDNIWLNDRDAVRTPMQWTPDRNSGFSSVDPGKLYLPVISSLVYHYNNVNVEAQIASSSSLLHWLRGMLQIRKRHPVFGLGSFEVCPAENDTILAFLRTVDGGEFDDVEPETVLCVNNLSSRPQASVDPAARPAQGCRGRGPLRRQRLPLGHRRGDADHHHRARGTSSGCG